MIGEIDIAGIFVSPLLVSMLAAFFLRLCLSWAFEKLGVYQKIWNRPLFDLSLFLILLGVSFGVVWLLTAS